MFCTSKRDKGQFSIEFVVVLSVLFVILASVTVPLYESSKKDAEKLSKLGRSRTVTTKLAGALNNVYGSGVGAKQTVEYSLPKNVSIKINENINENNQVDVQIELEDWKENNVVKTNTIIPCENWPKIDDNLSSEPDNYHQVVIEYKSPDENFSNPWIEVKEA